MNDVTAEQAQEKVNSLLFPECKAGDTLYYEGYWFIYENDQWVIDNTKSN